MEMAREFRELKVWNYYLFYFGLIGENKVIEQIPFRTNDPIKN